MSEYAYRILPKKEHEHWDNFVSKHQGTTTNYVRSILGEEVNELDFYQTYHKFHAREKVGNKRARKLFNFLKDFNWIK